MKTAKLNMTEPHPRSVASEAELVREIARLTPDERREWEKLPKPPESDHHSLDQNAAQRHFLDYGQDPGHGKDCDQP